MSLRIGLGTSDFLQLRLDGLLYVDKSLFVAELLRDPSRVLSFPRPRRFGKTLNLSTARHFLELPVGQPRESGDARKAFSGLAIEKAGEDVWRSFQRHPVIFLTFKDAKSATGSALSATAELIRAEARRLSPVFESVLDAGDRKDYDSLTNLTAPPPVIERSLLLLSTWLHRATGEKAFILIDEYDAPIHDAIGNEAEYDKIVRFFRNLFSAGLKDNSHLEKGVLTGILRVAKESMFSGLNNLEVCSLLRKPFATTFGFTEGEVESLCDSSGLKTEQRRNLREWYNGYSFGGHTIYNPWSVLSYLRQPDEPPRPFWANTGSDSLIRKLLIDAGLGLEADLEALLAGASIEKPIDEHTVFRDLEVKGDSIFSFLLMSGYLKANELVRQDDAGREHWKLSIPNKEVATVYRRLFLEWLNEGLGGETRQIAFCRALLAGDAAQVEEQLGTLLENTLSYHDTAGRAKEVVYQAFVAGLLVALESTHVVRSNRESGHGRCDVLVIPRKAGQPGVVLELKVLRAGESVEEALAGALEQIRKKDYAADVRAAGAGRVVEIGVVLEGKRVRVGRG